MLHRPETALGFLALLLTGLFTGFFYTWSFTVMPGFDATRPETAVAVMNAVNANIRSAAFAVVFFGAPLTTLLASIAFGLARRRRASRLTGLAFLALAAVLAVTAVQHVPWNEALASAAGASDVDPAALWAEYSAKWTGWNHVRAAGGTLALFFLAAALRTR